MTVYTGAAVQVFPLVEIWKIHLLEGDSHTIMRFSGKSSWVRGTMKNVLGINKDITQEASNEGFYIYFIYLLPLKMTI